MNDAQMKKEVEEVYGLIMKTGKETETQELFDAIHALLNGEEPSKGAILAAFAGIIAGMTHKLPTEMGEVEILGFAKACNQARLNARESKGIKEPKDLLSAIANALKKAGTQMKVERVNLSAELSKQDAELVKEFSEQARRDVETSLLSDKETLERVHSITDILNKDSKGARRFANDRRTAALGGAMVALLERADWVMREAVLSGFCEAVINLLKAREGKQEIKEAAPQQETETEQARRGL